MAITVSKINQQTDAQPYDKTKPTFRRDLSHHIKAKNQPKHRYQRHLVFKSQCNQNQTYQGKQNHGKILHETLVRKSTPISWLIFGDIEISQNQ